MNCVVFGAAEGLGRHVARLMAERGDALLLVGAAAKQMEASVDDLRIRFPQTRIAWSVYKGHDLEETVRNSGMVMEHVDMVLLNLTSWNTQNPAGAADRVPHPLAARFCREAHALLRKQGAGRLAVLCPQRHDGADADLPIPGKEWPGNPETGTVRRETCRIQTSLVTLQAGGGTSHPPAAVITRYARTALHAIDAGRPAVHIPPWDARRHVLRQSFLPALSIFLAFFLLYFSTGQAYRTLPGFSYFNNVFFGADQVDAMQGWVEAHKGTHPLVLLLVVPLSKVCARILSSYDLGLLCFGAASGAAMVTACFVLCRIITGRTCISVVLALFFGLSMSQMTFGCFADTYELAAFSLVPTYILTLLCLRHRKVYFPLWLIAGLLSFSITITGLVQTLLCLGTVLFSRKRTCIRSMAAIGALLMFVIGTGLALSLLQKTIWPDAQLFFQPHVYTHEKQYASHMLLEKPYVACEEILKTFFLFNFIGQAPLARTYLPGYRLQLIYFEAPIQYGWAAKAAAILWTGLLLRGIIVSFQNRESRCFCCAVALGLAFQMCLHAVYNTEEAFLYTPHFTFTVLLLGLSPESVHGKPILAAWCLLAVLTGCNNVTVTRKIVGQYGGVHPEKILARGSLWRYFPGRSSPGRNWMLPDYHDAAWKIGACGFGYGDHDDATVLARMYGEYCTLYTRASFHLDHPDAVACLWVDVDYDDGFVLYLNGHRVLRKNAPSNITYTSRATRLHEAGHPARFLLPRRHAMEGENILAVVGLNRKRTSSDFSLCVELTKVRR